MKEEPLLFPWLMDNVQLPAGSTPAPRDFMEVSGMPDREKVIKGLELVKQDIHEIFVSGSQIAVDCLRIDNALALLKEQEATIEFLVNDITFHNCNNCNRKDCESKPNAGQPVRSNCIYWLEGR